MLEKDKISVEINEKRRELRELASGSEFNEEKASELDKQITQLEKRFEYLAKTDPVKEEKKLEPAPTGEEKEKRELLDKVSINDFVACAVSGNQSAGVSEIQSAFFNGTPPYPVIPYEMLETRQKTGLEKRADSITGTSTAPDGSTISHELAPRLFARGVASRLLGVKMESVGHGIHSWPVLTGGTGVGVETAEGTARDAGAITVRENEGDIHRAVCRYVYSLEAAARNTFSLESALRLDLAKAMSDALDKHCVDTLLLTATGVTKVAQTTQANWNTAIGQYAHAVDGEFGYTTKDANIVLGVDTFRFFYTLMRGGNAAEHTVWRFLMQDFKNVEVSTHIPGKSNTSNGGNAKRQYSLVYKGGAPVESAKIGLYGGGVIVTRDPYTEAAAGRVAITLTQIHTGMLALRPDAFRRVEIQIDS